MDHVVCLDKKAHELGKMIRGEKTIMIGGEGDGQKMPYGWVYPGASLFPIDKSGYGNMDDWLPIGEIDSVRINGDQMPGLGRRYGLAETIKR